MQHHTIINHFYSGGKIELMQIRRVVIEKKMNNNDYYTRKQTCETNDVFQRVTITLHIRVDFNHELRHRSATFGSLRAGKLERKARKIS